MVNSHIGMSQNCDRFRVNFKTSESGFKHHVISIFLHFNHLWNILFVKTFWNCFICEYTFQFFIMIIQNFLTHCTISPTSTQFTWELKISGFLSNHRTVIFSRLLSYIHSATIQSGDPFSAFSIPPLHMWHLSPLFQVTTCYTSINWLHWAKY